MRIEVIKADTIDVAIEKILVELGADTTSTRENAIYFDGWDGLGASAVLQAVAERLRISNDISTRPTGLQFEKIIQIDCSKWESRRAMQREIAEQLKLSNWVMEMFDKQDEDDDFNGLDQSSRSEIAQVAREIYKTTQNHKFLVILHNGSNEEIDIFKFGLYIYGYANSKMLWTFQGRFRLDPKMIENMKKSTSSDVILSASRDQRDLQELWSYLVRHEAAQVSFNKHGHIIDPAIAAECVLYMLKQCSTGSHIVDYDWAVHTSNYWVCDGIIALTDIDKAWQVSDVLQREVRLLGIDNRLNVGESTIIPSSHLVRSTEYMPYWISTATCGFVLSPTGIMPKNMFQHSHRLGVLKLSRCTFSFSSPPFLCCHSLRFLWLEHCQDLLTRTSTTDPYQSDSDKEELDNNITMSWECFQNLWVLDLRYTDCDQILSTRVMDLMTQLRELTVMGAKNWDMSHLRGRLRNIRKLRVTKSTCYFNNDVFTEMEIMELLDFSGNTIRQGMTRLSGPASNSSLETVMVDGCDGLKMISFRGCKELKNMFLKGLLGSLEELDLSGTKVKTVDLRGVQSKHLKRIILLGCKKLRACVLGKIWPEVLRIDTTSTSTSTDRREASHAHTYGDRSLQKQKEEMLKNGWQISLTDARFLRCFPGLKGSIGNLHLDICTAATLGGNNVQGTSSDKLMQVQPHTSTLMGSMYRDALIDGPAEEIMLWDCPKIPIDWLGMRCVIEVIMQERGNELLEDAPGGLLFPGFIFNGVKSLHVYDNSSITSIPEPSQGSIWNSLTWCRIERCLKIRTAFTVHQEGDENRFRILRTFWASQLLSARFIWDKQVDCYFTYLKFLHLDHCPRLVHVHVLPFFISVTNIVLYSLETLEILYCGDLQEVFPLDSELEGEDVVEVPNLRHIHLHELPSLQRICGRRMSSPNLETIKVRGCWSLRRLPAVGRDTRPPKVDCEKEWWDNLEWDGLKEHHHPSLYEPTHSLYYKAQLPRVSLLR
ncbi:uncharacterized protein LOC124689503 [Lolium rigidum]|uniref:uncharacterized protein LOC124689503 n=1 Tax=Lolium rigidum TaxID=89674 RepID=UPI001F5DF03F|nr:uncharacterized protein LOC124689503 [Lolium rigidum]